MGNNFHDYSLRPKKYLV